MKFYLSSYNLGDKSKELLRLAGQNKKIGYISNACDHSSVDIKRKETKDLEIIGQLKDLGLQPEVLDLRDYFGKPNELRKTLQQLGGVFVRGGNVFVLRQAMKLSGFDEIFKELVTRDDFLYSGYSAGICILAQSLDSLQIVDNPTCFPYPEEKETIWSGLGHLPYTILPHHDSDHPESKDIEKTIEYCIKNQVSFKTLKDGEVIILE